MGGKRPVLATFLLVLATLVAAIIGNLVTGGDLVPWHSSLWWWMAAIAAALFAVTAWQQATAARKDGDGANRLRPARPFLAYAAADRDQVTELVGKLRADGVDPWIDEERIRPGKRRQEAITALVNDADAVVVCLSPRSVAGDVFDAEIAQPLRVAESRGDQVEVIPIQLEPTAVPPRFDGVHGVELYRPDGYSRLLHTLRNVARRRQQELEPVYVPERKGAAQPWWLAAVTAGLTAAALIAVAIFFAVRPQDPFPDNGRTVAVYNKVTNGPSAMVEDKPAYLSTRTHRNCKDADCAVDGSDLRTDDTVEAVCQTQGDEITNGNNEGSVDDANVGLHTSPRWYGVRLRDGTFGYLAEVWTRPDHRGGLGLPDCSAF